MPTTSFLKLNNEKQQKIIQISMAEFQAKNYQEASINQIVKEANIARGSFYVYFANKADLAKYLINTQILANIPKEDNNLNIFDYVAFLFEHIYKLFKDKEDLAKELLSSWPSQILDEVIAELFTNKQKIFQNANYLRFQSQNDFEIVSDLLQNILINALKKVYLTELDFSESHKYLLKQLLFLKIGMQK